MGPAHPKLGPAHPKLGPAHHSLQTSAVPVCPLVKEAIQHCHSIALSWHWLSRLLKRLLTALGLGRHLALCFLKYRPMVLTPFQIQSPPPTPVWVLFPIQYIAIQATRWPVWIPVSQPSGSNAGTGKFGSVRVSQSTVCCGARGRSLTGAAVRSSVRSEVRGRALSALLGYSEVRGQRAGTLCY